MTARIAKIASICSRIVTIEDADDAGKFRTGMLCGVIGPSGRRDGSLLIVAIDSEVGTVRAAGTLPMPVGACAGDVIVDATAEARERASNGWGI